MNQKRKIKTRNNLNMEKLSKLSRFIPPDSSTPLKNRIKEIPEKLVLEPNIPIGVFIQETYNIYSFARHDKELLCAKGMNWDVVEDIPNRIALLRDIEAEWWNVRYGTSPMQEEYNTWIQLAQKTKDELMEALKYAFREDKSQLAVIAKIDKVQGEENLDLTFDINSLVLMADRYKKTLLSVGTDQQVFEDLKACKEKLPDLVSRMGFENVANKLKLLERNRAYTFLVVALDELRNCAHYALRHNRKRLKGYASEYFRKSSRGNMR